MKAVGSIVPYTCIHIDADLRDILDAARRCLCAPSAELESWAARKLQELFSTVENPNHVLPCLSVRTGFDLFCRAMEFPSGSEIIVSAVNIPDMVTIAESHLLRVVPLDINIATLAPKVGILPRLISERTVAIVVAHLYGTTLDVTELLTVARRHSLVVVEDCAEAFGGFDYLGHPQSDLALFSFGVIKYRTAFGGAIAKVRDSVVYHRMARLYESYSQQTNLAYLRKLGKYAGIYFLINVPWVMRPGMILGKFIHWDYQESVVNWLRGFPAGLLNRIRLRPSPALLVTMAERLGTVPQDGYRLVRSKGEYVARKLASAHRVVGSQAVRNNFWLFPILVEDASHFSRVLNDLGVDSYKGATQLDVVLPTPDHGKVFPDPGISSLLPSLAPSSLTAQGVERFTRFECASQVEGFDAVVRGGFEWHRNDATLDVSYPHEAKHLIDHVVYLPVHKDVPFRYLDTICEAVTLASVEMRRGSPDHIVLLKSKL